MKKGKYPDNHRTDKIVIKAVKQNVARLSVQ